MLRLSQQAGQIAGYEQDLRSGDIHWSAGSEAVIGYSPSLSAMPLSKWLGMCHPDNLARTTTIVAAAYAQRTAYASYECRIFRPDTGAIRDIEARFSVEYDAEGRPRRSNAAVRDITEQRSTEASLRESQARLHSVVETAALGIIVTQADGRISSINAAGLLMFGYAQESSLIGCDLGLLMPDWKAFHNAAAPAVGASSWKLLGIRHDGSSFSIELSISSFSYSSSHFLTSIVCDVTLRSALEAERELHEQRLKASNAELELLSDQLKQFREKADYANQAKTRFLASMSHELRTPLNGVLGHAQLLRLEGGLNSAQSVRVDAMMGAGTHLLEMINRVLNLSEIEAEQFNLQAGHIDLQDVVSTCLDLVRPAAQAKGLALRLSIRPNSPSHINIDPTRLRQVLLNLLGNAVKFTARGSIELRMLYMPDKARLRIEVADTGSGIPASQRHLLFHEFERLDAGATAAVEGAGLGLALSARLTALMGGNLGHENRQTGGSVFWLELPLTAEGVAATELPTQPIHEIANLEPKPMRALHVLVVDDVAMNRDITSALLHTVGHTVVCATGGSEAIEAVGTMDFDVVLMDVRMPGMDGLEATRRIRALDGARGQLPIVALTAQAFAEQVKECREAGMNSHLTKPFTQASLLSAIADAHPKALSS